MNLDRARRVADAVLYEGYLLYPYRATSAKNQVRWQFGVLGPPGAAADGLRRGRPARHSVSGPRAGRRGGRRGHRASALPPASASRAGRSPTRPAEPVGRGRRTGGDPAPLLRQRADRSGRVPGDRDRRPGHRVGDRERREHTGSSRPNPLAAGRRGAGRADPARRVRAALDRGAEHESRAGSVQGGSDPGLADRGPPADRDHGGVRLAPRPTGGGPVGRGGVPAAPLLARSRRTTRDERRRPGLADHPVRPPGGGLGERRARCSTRPRSTRS